MDQATRHIGSSEDVSSMLERSHRSSVPASERRHSFRVSVPGRASIWRKNQLHGHYLLQDLCIEGCSLRGGPSCATGERVELVLHLPECPPLWISAEVRRGTRRGDQTVLALRFDPLPPRIEDRLQDLVVEMYARMHGDHEQVALVIESRTPQRQMLVQSLEDCGARALGVATPLDAVQLLLERGDRVHTAYIGAQREPGCDVELVEFLARHYPRIRRVLLGDAGAPGDAWLAEATGEVHALLETPYSPESLRKLVHRIAALPHEALS